MINVGALNTSTLFGIVLQLAMVITGHFVPYVRDNLFMAMGLGVSLFAGLLYGQRSSGFGGAALGGAIAGGLCAALAIGVSVFLRDTPSLILVFGTAGSTVTGLVGGLAGRAMAGTNAIEDA